MADMLARRIIVGSNNIAYFLDSGKLDGRNIVLYNSLKPELKLTITLPVESNGDQVTVREPVIGMLNINKNITDDEKAKDCTSIIQEAIDNLSENGGGIVHFGSGVYYITSLTMKPKVSLIGNGEGITILKRVIDGHVDSSTDGYNNGKGFITLPNNVTGCSIQDMTLYGGATFSESVESPLQYAGVVSYSDSEVVNGIYIESTPSTSYDSSTGSADIYKIHQDSSLDGVSSINNNAKFSHLQNLTIIGFSGSGIIVDVNNRYINIDHVSCIANRYSGLILTSPIKASNLHIIGNGTSGLICDGELGIIENAHIEYNGKYNHSLSCGVLINGSKCILKNMIIRYNYCTGLRNNGNNNMMSDIIFDANGGRSSYDVNGGHASPEDVAQVIYNGIGNSLKCNISNSRSTETLRVALSGLISETLSKSILECQISKVAGRNLPSINGSVYVTDTFNEFTSDSNLITVLYTND